MVVFPGLPVGQACFPFNGYSLKAFLAARAKLAIPWWTEPSQCMSFACEFAKMAPARISLLDAAILFIWKVLMCYVTYMLCDIKLLLYNVKQSTYNLWYNMLPQKWYKLKKCYITFACKVAKMARARCSYPIMILLSPVLSANATTHHLLGASAPAQNAGQGSVSTLCQLVSNGINWNQVGSSKWQKSSFRATLQEKCFFLCLWVRSTFTAHNKLTKAE